MSGSKLLNTTLEQKADRLEGKADRIKASKDVDSKVTNAERSLSRISTRLEAVADAGEELRFYVRLYTKAFQTSLPGTIHSLIRSALEKVDIDDDTVVRAAKNGRLSDIEDEVEDAENKIEDAISRVQNAIKSEQTDWEQSLESAKELNSIVGADSSFQNLIVDMETFLDQKMWNPIDDPDQLGAQWNRYVRKWKQNAGKHGWDQFQEQHGLRDLTIEELKQFTDNEPVRLSDLSIETLSEIKQVSELESALQLEVRS